jgi:transglutaminase-like putative cysteine protease
MIQSRISVTPKIRAQANSITSGISDRREQARAIYEWVSQHIRYVGIEFGEGSILPHDALNSGDTILNSGHKSIG